MSNIVSVSTPSVQEAKRLQEQLRSQVILTTTGERVSVIAAVDCSHAPPPKRGEGGQDARLVGGHAPGASMGAAGIILYRYPELVELSRTVIEHPVTFPYIPGLLAFRELPFILAAVESLSQLPDLLLVDGHGIAHPRRTGIAAHLGVVLDRSTIGCAKRVLTGQGHPPLNTQGHWTVLKDGQETLGALLRTRPGTQPIVVSPGHRIDLDTSLQIVRHCPPRPLSGSGRGAQRPPGR